MKIRHVEPADAAQITDIYNYYIANSHATFELDPIGEAEINNRINESLDGNYPFLVCHENGSITGYAYGRKFRPRRAYLHSVETSVYIKDGCEGRGIGTELYEELFLEIRQRDFHTIIAGISLPNEVSVRLHEKFGFEKVAHFREVGFKFGRWIDIGYWQLFLK